MDRSLVLLPLLALCLLGSNRAHISAAEDVPPSPGNLTGKHANAPGLTDKQDLIRLEALMEMLIEDVNMLRIEQKVMKEEFKQRLDQNSEGLQGIESIVAGQFGDYRPSSNFTNVPIVHRDCQSALDEGWVHSGIYRLSPDNETEFDVFCDQSNFGGGWIVFQRRIDGSHDFDQNWDAYRSGFGDIRSEFWIGNTNLRALTQKQDSKLRIELFIETDRSIAYADYNKFWIEDEEGDFRLHVSEFNSTNLYDALAHSDQQFFSTRDNENNARGVSCADINTGGWWYNGCHPVHLNGRYGTSLDWLAGSTHLSLTSVRMMLKRVKDKEDGVFFDCEEAYEQGYRSTGIYRLKLSDGTSEEALCDMEAPGQGWRVIQERHDGSVDFYRKWSEYKEGFGNLSTEFWIGNDVIHRLTTNQTQRLRIDMTGTDGVKGFAEYSSFFLADSSSSYTLYISGFSGSAGVGDGLLYSNGMSFTTLDRDNDRSGGNCAVVDHGGWWYKSCSQGQLNNLYGDTTHKAFRWYPWSGTYQFLSSSRMMICKRS